MPAEFPRSIFVGARSCHARHDAWALWTRIGGICLSLLLAVQVLRANPIVIPPIPVGHRAYYMDDAWNYTLIAGFGLVLEYLVYRWLMRPRQVTALRSATVFVVTHVVTWPLTIFAALFWGGMLVDPHGIRPDSSAPYLYTDCLAECCPVLIETLVYWRFLRFDDQQVTLPRALLMSAAGNLTSFAFGVAMGHWLWTIYYVPWRWW